MLYAFQSIAPAVRKHCSSRSKVLLQPFKSIALEILNIIYI